MRVLRQRLRDIAALIGRTDLVDLAADEKFLPEAIRNELEAHVYAKELELADLNTAMDELTAAVADSFQGGPDNDSADNADGNDHADTE